MWLHRALPRRHRTSGEGEPSREASAVGAPAAGPGPAFSNGFGDAGRARSCGCAAGVGRIGRGGRGGASSWRRGHVVGQPREATHRRITRGGRVRSRTRRAAAGACRKEARRRSLRGPPAGARAYGDMPPAPRSLSPAPRPACPPLLTRHPSIHPMIGFSARPGGHGTALFLNPLARGKEGKFRNCNCNSMEWNAWSGSSSGNRKATWNLWHVPARRDHTMALSAVGLAMISKGTGLTCTCSPRRPGHGSLGRSMEECSNGRRVFRKGSSEP